MCVCSSNEKLLFDVAVQTFLSRTSHSHSSPKAFCAEHAITENDIFQLKGRELVIKDLYAVQPPLSFHLNPIMMMIMIVDPYEN